MAEETPAPLSVKAYTLITSLPVVRSPFREFQTSTGDQGRTIGTSSGWRIRLPSLALFGPDAPGRRCPLIVKEQ
jgi:hypothetical protein